MAEAGVSADDMAEMKAQGAIGPQRPLSKI
jgi:hypothetical protein